MIAVEVEFLTGRFVATSYNNRSEGEWPPHFTRLFSAAVATLHEFEELGDLERQALNWWAAQDAPIIAASTAARRTVTSNYVPVNDTGVSDRWDKQWQDLTDAEAALKQAELALAEGSQSEQKQLNREVAKAKKARDKNQAKLNKKLEQVVQDDGKTYKGAPAPGLLPEKRPRQPRQFPSQTPAHPVVTFVWPDAEPDAQIQHALKNVLERIVRVGHSSSLVSCRLTESPPADTSKHDFWTPSDLGDHVLRTVDANQLDYLEQAFARHQGVAPRQLPCRFQRYRKGDAEQVDERVATSVFGTDWIVLRVISSDGNNRRLLLQLSKTEDLTRALRGGLMSHAPEPISSVISGHNSDRTPVQSPHLAFVPLADVSSKWSDGSVLGAAIVLPRELDDEARNQVFRAVGEWEAASASGQLRLMMGRAGALTLERIASDEPRKTLQPFFWTQPARRWTSVTAIALDQNPGDLSASDSKVWQAAEYRAEQIIAKSCQRIGLPTPESVSIMPHAMDSGAPAARNFMPYPRQGKGHRRVCVHAEIIFEEPVRGPVLLGAGRYFGLGLCRPHPEKKS